MASGMSYLADQIEAGQSPRDAVAKMYEVNRNVIFTGNGYSPEWPAEAAKRNLPNLNTTPKAIKTWNSAKNIKVFQDMAVFTPEETEARSEIMYEAYITTLSIEAQTMIDMTESGILPACAKDLALYKDSLGLAGDREKVYGSIKIECDELKNTLANMPHDMAKEAEYLCETVKPQMARLRDGVDKAEGLMSKGLYPYPTYEAMLYHHHH
jgi:glutamine synthetase